MQYIASISYGKDSLAMLEAIKILGLPLDRIVTAEVWATDTIPADLPPMMEFKEKADRIIKERYGIDVEHFFATDKDGNKRTYESEFYHVVTSRRKRERESTSSITQATDRFAVSRYNLERGATAGSRFLYYRGFPHIKANWCTGYLKTRVFKAGGTRALRGAVHRHCK